MTEILENQEHGENEMEFDLSPEEFVEDALLFPCFEDAKLDRDAAEIFKIMIEAYKEDNLTEEQDLVIELLLHMRDSTSPFNLKRASEVWSEGDLDAFWAIISHKEDWEDQDEVDHNQ